MTAYRAIQRIIHATPTLEGAGVRLKRAFGFHEPRLFDPFLLLDDFRGEKPEDFIAGFPWHPHRGIETITYVIDGAVTHEDSIGNAGTIAPGDVQWMTAGNGILHQEMPKPTAAGRMGGFQLWATLPASHNMMNPRYQEVLSGMIPTAASDGGTAGAGSVRLVCRTSTVVPSAGLSNSSRPLNRSAAPLAGRRSARRASSWLSRWVASRQRATGTTSLVPARWKPGRPSASRCSRSRYR